MSRATPVQVDVVYPAPGEAVAIAGSERLVSLDVFRGFTMFWLLGGKAFVVAVAALAGVESVRYQLAHSDWEGVRYYDLIWPSFMLMVGVSIPFSLAKRLVLHTRGEFLRSAWRRAAVLFLLGSLRETLHDGVPRLIELSSALQPIAVAYLFCCYIAAWPVRGQLAAALGILAGYAALLHGVAAPGVAAGSYEINRNLVTAVDQMVLGRAHKDGWGTVLTAIPAVATTIIGMLLGRGLTARRRPAENLALIAATAAACLAAGYALSLAVPVIMKLWTASYGLISAGWACALFALFFWLVEVCGWRWGTFPLVVIGANALAAYLLPTLLPVRKVAGILTAPLAKELGAAGAVLTTGTALLAAWLVLWWMYRRRIFLKG